jgi:hypothetical protein
MGHSKGTVTSRYIHTADTALGLALALAVQVISWLKQSALFFVLAAVLLIGLSMTFWPREAGRRGKSEKENHRPA